MEMKAHLTEEELAQAWFEPGRGTVAHLENCDRCRMELKRLRQAMQSPEIGSDEVWDSQRQRIWDKIETSRSSPQASGLRWSCALAALILLAATLSMNSGNRIPEPIPAQAKTQVDSDHELLLEVDRIVQSDGPIALQPAGLMTETQLNQHSAMTTQESTHAN